MTMRLNDHGGLACTESGWALAILLALAWLVAPALALIRRADGSVSRPDAARAMAGSSGAVRNADSGSASMPR